MGLGSGITYARHHPLPAAPARRVVAVADRAEPSRQCDLSGHGRACSCNGLTVLDRLADDRPPGASSRNPGGVRCRSRWACRTGSSPVALHRVSPQEAGAITLLEPVLNPLWAYLISPETDTPTAVTWIGGVLILGALAYRYLPRERVHHKDTKSTKKTIDRSSLCSLCLCGEPHNVLPPPAAPGPSVH